MLLIVYISTVSLAYIYDVVCCAGDSSSDDEPIDEMNGEDDIDSSDDDTQAVSERQGSPMIE